MTDPRQPMPHHHIKPDLADFQDTFYRTSIVTVTRGSDLATALSQDAQEVILEQDQKAIRTFSRYAFWERFGNRLFGLAETIANTNAHKH